MRVSFVPSESAAAPAKTPQGNAANGGEDEATRRALPDRIRWRVEARDDFGLLAVSESASP